MNENMEKELELDVEETVETNGKKAKRELADNRQNITNINDYIRFVTHGDGNRELQKLHKYTDGSEEWIRDGWYGSKDDGAMFRNIISMVRDNKLKEKQISDLKYYIKCFDDAKSEITKYFRVEF